jgi:hypothetical protein
MPHDPSLTAERPDQRTVIGYQPSRWSR